MDNQTLLKAQNGGIWNGKLLFIKELRKFRINRNSVDKAYLNKFQKLQEFMR